MLGSLSGMLWVVQWRIHDRKIVDVLQSGSFRFKVGLMSSPILSGHFDHTLDPKGRVTLPARYREYFSHGAVLVLLPDREPCISVFRRDAWSEFEAKHLEALDVFDNPDHSWTIRETYEKLDEIEPDRQGRVLIPAGRIADLNLSGRVKIVGVKTHLEIWNPDTYAEIKEQRRGGHA